MEYTQPLLSQQTYHIVSRAIGNEKLFITDENYTFFLNRFYKYILPVAKVFAYSLLPNHFHFLLEIKKEEELLPLFQAVKKNREVYETWQPDFVMQQFSNLLNSYSKSINKIYKRKGSLFINTLKRVLVENESQLSSTLFYVHKNPVHHGYCEHINDWPWSSYRELLANSPTKLNRDKVLGWFGNKEQFIKFHSQPIILKNAKELE